MRIIIIFIFFTFVSSAQPIEKRIDADSTLKISYSNGLPLDSEQRKTFDQYDFIDWNMIKAAVAGQHSFSISVTVTFLMTQTGNVIKETIALINIGGTKIINKEYEQKIISGTKNVISNLPPLTLLLKDTHPKKTRYIVKLTYRKCR